MNLINKSHVTTATDFAENKALSQIYYFIRMIQKLSSFINSATPSEKSNLSVWDEIVVVSKCSLAQQRVQAIGRATAEYAN